MKLTNLSTSIFEPFGFSNEPNLPGLFDGTIWVAIYDELGLSVNICPVEEFVYIIREVEEMSIITTSGIINVNTLSDVINNIIENYGGRLVDYIVSLKGSIMVIINSNDSFYYFNS